MLPRCCFGRLQISLYLLFSRSFGLQHLDDLVAQARAQIATAEELAALDAVRVTFLGKKGVLTEQLKSLGKLSAEERPAAGQAINKAKQAVQQALEERKAALEDIALQAQLKAEAVDMTLAGRGQVLAGCGRVPVRFWLCPAGFRPGFGRVSWSRPVPARFWQGFGRVLARFGRVSAGFG